MNSFDLQHWTNRLTAAWPTSLIVGVIVLFLTAVLIRAIAYGRRDLRPLYIRKPLLTENELDFVRQLRAVCPPDVIVCPQVALSALVDVAEHVIERRAARNCYSQCYADFVLCRAESYDVIGIIELDDRTHERAHRRARDQRLNAMYASIALPVAHVPARRTGRYTTRDAQTAIDELRRQSAAQANAAKL